MNINELVAQYASARKQNNVKIKNNTPKITLTKEQKFEIKYEKYKQKYFDKIVNAYRSGDEFIVLGSWEQTQDYPLFVVNKLKDLGYNALTTWDQDIISNRFRFKILVRFE